MRISLVGTLLGFCLFAAIAAAAELPDNDPVRLAQQVHDIFEAKCVDCHGPELPRPKGKFGYVLDLKRVADNPEYVVKGNGAKSEIYKMVFNDEMPGEDANVPPLTAQEKEIVKRWIDCGASGDLPAGKAPEPSVTVAQPKAPEPLGRHLVRWIGQLHPLSTHFPVALMFVAVLAESLAWATRRDSWLQTVRFLIVIAALGAVAAAVLGWLNAYFSSYNKEPWKLLWWHRWLGTGTGVWAVICAAAAFMGECREGSKERIRLRVALLLGAGLVGLSGFLGSALIYGLDHYAWK